MIYKTKYFKTQLITKRDESRLMTALYLSPLSRRVLEKKITVEMSRFWRERFKYN